MAKRKTPKKPAKTKPAKAAKKARRPVTRKKAPAKKAPKTKPVARPSQRKSPPRALRRTRLRHVARGLKPMLPARGLNPYDKDLDRNAANYQPLTPIGFL